MFFLSKLFKPNKFKTVNEWLDVYIKILLERELKYKTLEIKFYLIKVIRNKIGNKNIRNVTPIDISNLIQIYIDQDKRPSAKSMYHLLRDVFREAYAHDWNDRNPAEPIKCPKVDVKRSRMILNEFKKIVEAADKNPRYHYIRDAMLTGIVTAQRRADISTMKKTHVKRNYLQIQQQKTGSKIALPVKLKCKKVGISIQDIINQSQAQYVVTKKGKQVLPKQITSGFARLRDKVFSRDYWPGTPTTFHEIRSLAERLYREQKIDTMTLLGHKSQAMTDRCNDSRGREWRYLKIKLT